MPKGRYEAADIEVLEGLEPVRRRPEMYVGDLTAPATLAALTLETLCLAVDVKTGGPARCLSVTLHCDDTAEVENDGPGLPLGGRADVRQTYVELIMTKLHACRAEKADEANQRWCRTGVAVLCALAEWCDVTIQRDGGIWRQRFVKGAVAAPIARVGDTTSTGTSVRFKPDRSILLGAFDAELIAQQLRELAVDVPCLTTRLRDLRRA